MMVNTIRGPTRFSADAPDMWDGRRYAKIIVTSDAGKTFAAT